VGNAVKPVEFHLSFQSRVGPIQWLRPYTDDKIRELGEEEKVRLRTHTRTAMMKMFWFYFCGDPPTLCDFGLRSDNIAVSIESTVLITKGI
jgi:hypothetical protein